MLTRSKGMAEINDLKKTLDEIKSENTATNKKIDELIKKLTDKEKKIVDLEARVEALEGEIKLQKTVNLRLEQLIDDHEQYGRRTSLRITGIPKDQNETALDCVNAVKSEIVKLGIEVPENCIDRAHRVGRPKANEDGSDARAIIVKFKSFSSRTMVYKKRPKWTQGNTSNIRFTVDLTKRRLALKNKAIELVKGIDAVDFVFADINCSLCMSETVKTVNLNFSYLRRNY